MSRYTPPGGARARRSVAHLILPFDGYPYLVTRIGHSALRHIAILPATWSRERLLGLAHRQVVANQLVTCLALGPGDAVYVTTDGGQYRDANVPTGLPVVERLRLAAHLPRTPEMAARRARLRAYAAAQVGPGYIVGDGLEGGRPATREDLIRFVGLDGEASPVGLTRCPTCGELAGDYLATKGEGNGDRRPRVIRVHCRCENHNRCARCGEPLAERRLSAYHFSEETGEVCYVAAYCAFSHHCGRIRREVRADADCRPPSLMKAGAWRRALATDSPAFDVAPEHHCRCPNGRIARQEADRPGRRRLRAPRFRHASEHHTWRPCGSGCLRLSRTTQHSPFNGGTPGAVFAVSITPSFLILARGDRDWIARRPIRTVVERLGDGGQEVPRSST